MMILNTKIQNNKRMSRPPFHVPMALIKSSIVHIGRIVNAERPNETEPTEPLDITVVDKNNETLGTIEGSITLIRNTPSPNVFGANVRIERHFFQVPAGEGFVDYVLILMQVDQNAPLGHASIRINWVDLPEGIAEPNLFVAQVIDQILNEW